MSGSISDHLIKCLDASSPSNSSVVTHGAMSFVPMMHGTPSAHQPFNMFGSQLSFMNESMSEETAFKIAALQAKLDKKLGPEYISQRPGPGGGPKLTYLEGWKAINLANEVFGFNGWSSSVVSLTTDFVDFSDETKKYNVGITAIVRVTLRDGVSHEDIGYGLLENARSKGAALDKCKKEAVTDGLKRALRNFGNIMGNCLYDKSYASEVVKIKVQQPKFKKEGLHRRPEFDEVKPNTAASSTGTKVSEQNTVNSTRQLYSTPSKPPAPQSAAKMCTSTDTNICPEAQASANVSSTSMTSTTRILPPQQQQHQQAEQRVSFAKPEGRLSTVAASGTSVFSSYGSEIKVEKDQESDDYGFNDAEFLAMAEEADIGLAVGDDDMGRPIDHEEGLLPSLEELTHGDSENPVAISSNPQAFRRHQPFKSDRIAPSAVGGCSLNRTLSREQQIAAALRGDSDEITSSTSGSADSKTSDRSVSTTTSITSNTSNPSSVLATKPVTHQSASAPEAAGSMRPPHVPAVVAQRHSRQGPNEILSSRVSSMSSSVSWVQQRHQQMFARRQQQEQNENANPQQANTTTSTNSSTSAGFPNGSAESSKRLGVMSMGEFQFPPGFDPSKVAISSTPVSAQSTSLKRTTDVMNGSSGAITTNHGFKGAPGMGLQQHQGPGQRQILGPLEIGDGRDVKRVRRG